MSLTVSIYHVHALKSFLSKLPLHWEGRRPSKSSEPPAAAAEQARPCVVLFSGRAVQAFNDELKGLCGYTGMLNVRNWDEGGTGLFGA